MDINISKEKAQELLDEIKNEIRNFLESYSLVNINGKKISIAYSSGVDICKISEDNILIMDCYLNEYANKTKNYSMSYYKEYLYVKIKVAEKFKYIVEKIVSKYDN